MKLEGNKIHQIEKTELLKDLGILISNELKWENYNWFNQLNYQKIIKNFISNLSNKRFTIVILLYLVVSLFFFSYSKIQRILA